MLKLFVAAACTVMIAGAIAVVDRSSLEYSAPAHARSAEAAVPPTQIYASGIVEGRTEDVELQPESSGRVAEMLVKLGDWVDANQVLLRLDDRSQRAQVAVSLAKLQLAQANVDRLINGAREAERQEARALLTAKQARLKQAMLTWQRIQTLRAQDAVAQQEADDQEGVFHTLSAEVEACRARLNQLEAPAREDELRAAQARVAAAQADYELSQIALDRTALRAPYRAQIIDLHVEPGETITPGSTKPVIVLADTSQLRVRAFVEEIDAPRVVPGMAAVVTADGLAGQALAAVVESVSPRMNAKTMTTGQPDELYDTKLREVVLALKGATPLIVGLRVDVVVDAVAK